MINLNAKLLVVALLLAGCSSGLDTRYLNSSINAQLELPPDLSVYQAESNFELPAAFSGDDANSRDKVPVLAKVESLRLQGSAGLYWLNVDASVDNLYQQVKNFWAAEGYRLVLDEPVIGVMQTEWIYRKQGGDNADGSWFERLFKDDNLSASQDQFRTRIERADSGANRIYVAHRGTEYIHVVKRNDRNLIIRDKERNDWHFRQPEPELEIEMLSRLMVYLGLQQEQVQQQLANTKLFSPRASIHVDSDESAPFLLLKDAYPIAWNRVYHHLERLNFEILSSEFKTGLAGEGVIRVKTLVAEGDENPSWFSSTKKSKPKEVVLVFSEATHETTRVDIENDLGDFDTSVEGNEFLSFLFQHIK